jgi:hypothetical protein
MTTLPLLALELKAVDTTYLATMIDVAYRRCSGPLLYVAFTYSLLQAGLGLTMVL